MRRITVPYRTALGILRDYSGTTESSSAEALSDTSVLNRLRPSMELIAACERDVAPLRSQWNSENTEPGSELSQLIEEHSALLKELIELLNRVEARMTISRQRLGAELDDSAKHNAMRNAYSTTTQRQF
ncbi:MAG: hypothetical protein R3C49_08095 [Planctomycetaceae bacterium]